VGPREKENEKMFFTPAVIEPIILGNLMQKIIIRIHMMASIFRAMRSIFNSKYNLFFSAHDKTTKKTKYET
jgi:hypothetical protein